MHLKLDDALKRENSSSRARRRFSPHAPVPFLHQPPLEHGVHRECLADTGGGARGEIPRRLRLFARTFSSVLDVVRQLLLRDLRAFPREPTHLLQALSLPPRGELDHLGELLLGPRAVLERRREL